MTEPARKTALMVLGMHRSGTSSLTRVLSLCGATLPGTLLAPVAGDNDRGFWESERLVRLDDDALKAAGVGKWRDPGLVPGEWFRSAAARALMSQMVTALEEEYGHRQLIVIKDPRMCRLVPLWHDVLRMAGYRGCFVLIVRNPLEVAASLARRNGMGEDEAYLLWVQHMVAAERDTRDAPRVMCTYAQVLERWRELVVRIGRELDVPFEMASLAGDTIDAFLDPRLRHHHQTRADLEAADGVPRWVMEIYRDLESEATGARATAGRLRDVEKEVMRAEQAFTPALRAMLSREREELKAGKRELQTLRDRHTRQAARAHGMERELGYVRTKLAQARRRNETLDEALALARRQVSWLEAERSAIQGTRAWRLASLVRSLFRAARGSPPGRLVLRSAWLAKGEWPRRRRQLEEVALLRASPAFDEHYYLSRYPALAHLVMTPVEHFVFHGAAEGRWPNPVFDSGYYLDQDPELRRSGINPLVHFLQHGAVEGRNPSTRFDTVAYLQNNPGLLETGRNPIEHYLSRTTAKGVPARAKPAVASWTRREARFPGAPASLPDPCIIGATGGSGTRVVAQIARRARLFTGADLNVSEDAVAFGHFSDRWINPYIELSGSWRCAGGVVPPAMVEHFRAVVESHLLPLTSSSFADDWQAWGWKEPRSIYLLPFWHSQFVAMKFLHVVRDGRDMALSANQNQLNRHGPALLPHEIGTAARPIRSIALWNRINLMAADFGERYLGERYLRIRYEDLCANPVPTIARMLEFLELQGDPDDLATCAVRAPGTARKWWHQDSGMIDQLDRTGAEALVRFGYV